MYPRDTAPGLGIFVSDQIEALRELDGVEVELFSFNPETALSYLSACVAVRRRAGKGHFDVVHAHYGLTGWTLLSVSGSPRMVTFHGTDLHHHLVGPLSRTLCRWLDLCAPVSKALAQGGLGRAKGVKRTAVLPCGANLDRFVPIDRQQARHRLGLDVDGRYLLFAADPRRASKRYDRARAVAQAFDGVELLWLEDVAPDEVPFYINAANAVIVPSEREGFGLAPIEALACDVAVAATPVGVAPLVLRGVAGTLCASFEPSVFVDALRPHLVAEDPRIQGRARAALFDRRRFARRVLSAYADLAASEGQ